MWLIDPQQGIFGSPSHKENMSTVILVKEEGNEQEVVKDSAQHKDLVKKGWKDKNAPKKAAKKSE